MDASDAAAAALRQAEPDPAPVERREPDKATECAAAHAREQADAGLHREVSVRAARAKSPYLQVVAEEKAQRAAERQAALARKLAAQTAQDRTPVAEPAEGAETTRAVSADTVGKLAGLTAEQREQLAQ